MAIKAYTGRMNAITSTRYVSAAATGETWRDISKKVLEDLESVRTDGFRPNMGFLYLTDALAADAGSILTLFRSVTGIERWTGCAAIGVCANGIEYVGVPAISVLVGQVNEADMHAFHAPAHGIKNCTKSWNRGSTSTIPCSPWSMPIR